MAALTIPKRANTSQGRVTGEGLVARLTPIRGVTPKGALARTIYLPALLGTFTVAETALHTDYDTLTGGQYSMAAQGPARARQLRTLSADTMTVDFDASWLVATGQDAEELRARLYEIMRFRKAVHLLVTFNPRLGRPPELDMPVTIRQISKDVRPGENESRYLTLSLEEWRDPSVGRRTSQPTSPAKVSLPATRALQASDTLASLSMAYYGSYAFWRGIRDANGVPVRWGQKTPLVSLGGRWRVGLKIKIPALAASLTFSGGNGG